MLEKMKEWMTPERALAMQGIGLGLSQMNMGQAPNLSPVYEALEQRKQSAQMRKVMDVPGVLDSFSPQQRAVLATMPESLATQIIMDKAFQAPAAPEYLTVDGTVLQKGPNGLTPVWSSPADPADPVKMTTFEGPDGTVYQFHPVTGKTVPLTGGKAQPVPMTPQERAAWGIPDTDTTPYAMVDGLPKPIGGSGVTVNNTLGGGPAPAPLGTEGQIMVPDPSEPSGYRIEIAPGSKMDQERKAAELAAANASGIADTTGDTIVTAATRAKDANSDRILGGVLGALAAYNPSTPNAEVYRQTESLKSIASIENITAMRKASPTGAALGAASDKDIELLKNKHGALDPASPNYERDLLDYTRALLRTVHGPEAGDAIFQQTFGGAGAAPAGTVPDGIDPAVWDALTPEERALWD